MSRRKWGGLGGGLLVVGLAACAVATPQFPIPNSQLPAPNPQLLITNPQLPALTPTPIVVGAFTLQEAAIQTPTPEPAIQVTQPLTATPALASLAIEALAARAYGTEGRLRIVEALESPPGFARALITYPSDGLTIYGFMNVPAGSGPFPVVIMLHGYIEKRKYETLAYSVRYADDLAWQGYIVIHPNLRGYPPSDDGPNPFEIGRAVDVLNLIALVKTQAGLPGPLWQAEPEAIALWGHSTGGGIALRVLTVSPAVRAAVLLAPMSGDEAKNAYRTYWTFSGETRWQFEITVPESELAPISPANYYGQITAAVSLHHGEQDSYVPVEWTKETCAALSAAGQAPECFYYPAQAHNFCCEGYEIFFQRVLAFYARTLHP